MIKKVILCGVFIFMFCSQANAANWVELIPKEYLDKDSIKLEDTGRSVILKYWVKTLNKNGDFNDFEKLYKQKIWYLLAYIHIDCLSKTVNTRDIILYNTKGSLVDRVTLYEWNNIIPNTRPEIFYNGYCKN